MKKRTAKLLIVAVLITMSGAIGAPSEITVSARDGVRISASKRNYFLHGVWDKLTLKNVPTGARVRWKSSNKNVVRIREHIPNGIWYQVRRDGEASIIAVYNRKKYRCRIKVKRETEDMTVTSTPSASGTSSPESSSDPVGASQTSSPADNVLPCSPTPTVSVSPNQAVYDQRITDFKEQYLTEDMSEYDKVDAICRFISDEFDYGHEANWFSMVVKGYGDCMASRIGVNRLCTELGIVSYICRDLNDHGETMVRIGDEIYMTVTGYGGVKPRLYRIYQMSEAELSAKIERYPSCRHVLGLD